jgi:hypothetical protein
MKRKHQDFKLVPFPATRFALRLKELIESGFGLIDQNSVSRQITFCN